MFFLSLTKRKLDDAFESLNVKEIQSKPFVITIVTDNFLSKLTINKNGFSVIEAPFVSSDNFQDIILGRVIFQENDNTLEIFKPTISGRPIYYHINSDGEFFCSTHIALLREAGVVIQENQKALPEYFVYRLIMPPRTLYKDIEQLAAGSRLFLEFNNDRWQIKKILLFEPPVPDKKYSSLKKISEQTLHLLTESIRALNPCKERLSIIQSGGLDSSVLYQLCRRIYGSDETYSTGFPFEDPKDNLEKQYALTASHALKSKHTYCEFSTKEYLHGFIKGIAAAEEPMHHLQSVLLYLLFGRLPENKNIVISGEGADSSFGSSINSRVYRLNSLIVQLVVGTLKSLRIAALTSKRWQNRIKGLSETKLRLNKSLHDPDHILWSIGYYGSKNWACNYFGVSDFDVIEGRYSTIRLFENRSIYDQITLVSFLGGASVSKSIWSKLGENKGKIVHYPFGYDDLLHYIHTVPWDLKLRNSKNILREVAKKIDLPGLIINRPKQSFGIDADKWGEKGGVFEPLIPLCAGVFDIREIQKMQSSELEKAMTFWNMLNYAIWKRLCINNEPVDVLLDELDDSIEGFKGSGVRGFQGNVENTNKIL
jgi:asparagine synthetase B (glutamine-hydrolysing)